MLIFTCSCSCSQGHGLTSFVNVLHKVWQICVTCQLHWGWMGSQAYCCWSFWSPPTPNHAYITLVEIMCKLLLAWFKLTQKILTYVEEEGSNLNMLALAPSTIISCEPLQLENSFVRSCFKHAMFKACSIWHKCHICGCWHAKGFIERCPLNLTKDNMTWRIFFENVNKVRQGN